MQLDRQAVLRAALAAAAVSCPPQLPAAAVAPPPNVAVALALTPLLELQRDVDRVDAKLESGDSSSDIRALVKKLVNSRKPRALVEEAIDVARLDLTRVNEAREHAKQANEWLASVVEFDALDDLNNERSSRLADLTPTKAGFVHRSLGKAEEELGLCVGTFEPADAAAARSLLERSANRRSMSGGGSDADGAAEGSTGLNGESQSRAGSAGGTTGGTSDGPGSTASDAGRAKEDAVFGVVRVRAD